jgi:hypothetical protein
VRGFFSVLVLVLVLVLDLSPRRAHADPPQAVALLPLDADQRLEIYGQPVASEIARTLVAGGIDVVVVGPKMTVPDRARLVLDGTITSKGDVVSLAIRIRERASGSVLDKLDATAPTLTAIDKAAADLSARVLPSVKARLATLDQQPTSREPHPEHMPPPAAAPQHVLVGTIATGPLHDALASALGEWAPRHHWITADKDGDATIALDNITYTTTPGEVPRAHARVHVKITDRAKKALFDRVVVTDTIVGDKNLAADKLAARTAREVLYILDPHMRRVVPSWR